MLKKKKSTRNFKLESDRVRKRNEKQNFARANRCDLAAILELYRKVFHSLFLPVGTFDPQFSIYTNTRTKIWQSFSTTFSKIYKSYFVVPLNRETLYIVETYLYNISFNMLRSKSGTYSSVAESSSCEKPFLSPASKNISVASSYSSSVSLLESTG